MERTKMKDRKDKATADRRSFLKLAGLGAVAGGTALVAGDKPAEAASEATAGTDGLYRETEHVKRYYELAKFI